MIEIETQVIYNHDSRKSSQPLWTQTGLSPRKFSTLLQRRAVDFSSHRSFAESIKALEEHYGLTIPYSALRQVTEQIGQEITHHNASLALPEQGAQTLIVELDGSMIPIVEYSQPSLDQQEQGLKRKRDCHWKEFRLSTVNVPGETSTHYGVARGTPFEAGCMMYQTAQQKGLNDETFVHGVADGAPWIAEQYEEQFGDQHRFLLDFYHSSEYLAEASKSLPVGLDSKSWFEEKKNDLKQGRSSQVIIELEELCERHSGEESPLHLATQYLKNREDQLQYDQAMAQDLPIGSGAVESGHKSVLQARLKKPGAWWKIENAQSMAQIKVTQANGTWDNFWKKRVA